jgi:hypothetical protein
MKIKSNSSMIEKASMFNVPSNFRRKSVAIPARKAVTVYRLDKETGLYSRKDGARFALQAGRGVNMISVAM